MAPYFSMPFPTILTYRTVLILLIQKKKINTVPRCRYRYRTVTVPLKKNQHRVFSDFTTRYRIEKFKCLIFN